MVQGVLITLPLAALIVFGEEFYQLWIPSQDSQILQMLSVLTCFGMIFTCGIQNLYNVFTVVNKLKTYSLLILTSGVTSTIIVFLLLQFTNLGIFAIVGVSSFVNIVRNFLYTIPYGAIYLGLKWNTFIPEVIYSVLSVILSVVAGLGVKNVVLIDSWLSLFISVSITLIIGFFVNIIVVLNKQERKYLMTLLQKK